MFGVELVCFMTRYKVKCVPREYLQVLRPRFSKYGNNLKLNYSDEAQRLLRKNRNQKEEIIKCKSEDEVRKEAIAEVKRLGGNEEDEVVVLGLQFGRFYGQKFVWLLENGLGYAGWFVDNMRLETVSKAPLSQNKQAFEKYLMSFKQGIEVVKMKQTEREAKSSKCKFFYIYI